MWGTLPVLPHLHRGWSCRKTAIRGCDAAVEIRLSSLISVLREKLWLRLSCYAPCLSCIHKNSVRDVNSVQMLWGVSLFFLTLGDGDFTYISVLIVFCVFNRLLRPLKQIKGTSQKGIWSCTQTRLVALWTLSQNTRRMFLISYVNFMLTLVYSKIKQRSQTTSALRNQELHPPANL